MSDRPEESPTPEPTEASPESVSSETPETGDSAVAATSADSSESAAAAEPAEIEAKAAAAAEPEAVAENGSEPVEEPIEAEEAVSAEPEPEAVTEPAEAAEATAAEAQPEAAVDSEPEAAAAQSEAAAAQPEAEAAEAVDSEPKAAVAEAAEATEVEAAAEMVGATAPKASAGKPLAASSPEVGSAMSELETAMAEKRAVKGQVIGWNKGGYHVAVGKIAAFCPVSQIEIGSPRSPKRYLDKTFSFQVIEIQDGGRRVVLSRAGALKAEREQRAALVRELLEPGAEIEGKVRSLTDFGAFVDLGGGIEGLVHVSEISRRRVEHPKEVLKTGQKVKVSVLKIEKGGQRISLSMKRLEPDPWKGVADRFPVGSEFTGTIQRQTDFGLFVEVEPGLEGLVHTSRLDLGMTLEDEGLQVGKEISGWVHEVEPKRRRLSLSLRQVAGGNPWQGVGDRYPVGEVVKGKVERLASFGVFIQLEPGLTGLLPFSVLGSGPGSNPRRQYHAGKEVSVRVLSIDRGKRRISLGTESSKAEGNQQDFREYQKAQRRSSDGLNTMEAAFAKLKEQQREQAQ